MPFDEVRETPVFWNDLPEPQSNIYEEQFHDFEGQFPSTMRGLPHKAIWRGLLSGHGFAAFEPLLKSGFVTSSLVPFLVEKLGCEVSSNLGGTIVYLATNMSQAVIDAAIETLENLLSLAVSADLLSSIQHRRSRVCSHGWQTTCSTSFIQAKTDSASDTYPISDSLVPRMELPMMFRQLYPSEQRPKSA